MPRIKWYGPEVGGPRSTGARVSYTRAVAAAVRLKAMEIGHEAAFLLDSRAQRRTGDSQIITRHYPNPGFEPGSTGDPIIDSFVLLADPDPGNGKGRDKGAALSIENTHHVLRDAVK